MPPPTPLNRSAVETAPSPADLSPSFVRREPPLILLYVIVGAALGYTSRSMPLNLAPSDGAIALALSLPLLVAARRASVGLRTVPIVFGVWLIAVGQLLPARQSFGFIDVGELVKDVAPPLICLAMIRAIRTDIARGAAIVVGATVACGVAALYAFGSTATRFRGPLGNPNLTAHFAAALAVTVVGFFVHHEVKERWPWRRWLQGAALAAAAVVLLKSASFGALLMLFGAFAYLAWSVVHRLPPAVRPFTRIGLVLLSVVIVPPLATNPRIPDIGGGAGLGDTRFQRSRTGRGELWQAGLDRVQSHPLGGGPRPFASVQSVFGSIPGPGEFHADLLDMAAAGGVLAVVGSAVVVVALWGLAERGGWARALIFGCIVSSAVRQTWNFRHMWVFIGALIAVEMWRGRDRCASSS